MGLAQPMSDNKSNLQQKSMDSLLSSMLSVSNARYLLGLNHRRIDNVAWHDFSYYEYFREPEYFTSNIDFANFLSPAVIDFLDNLGSSSIETSEIVQFFNELSTLIFDIIKRMIASLADETTATHYLTNHRLIAKLIEIYETALIKSGRLSTIYEIYFSITADSRNQMFSKIMFDVTNFKYYLYDPSNDPSKEPHLMAEWSFIADSLLDQWQSQMIPKEEFQEEVSEHIKLLEYPFHTFMPYSWNIGLRYQHRQEWRPLGIQRGETVRTIPLGPKQTEKVSTKIIRRKKLSTTSESLTSIETTTETSDTTKDSSELVDEAAKTFGWHVESEASASWGFGNAKVSGGVKSESQNKSKSANKHLSERIQKTASKSRTETKVIVNTESETTFEEEIASEIQNPNDEVPITYVYSKLQRQYEIFTSLNEVSGVIFVAEPVPLPHQITKEWVKKYDWIISQHLLDDSFRESLLSISQEIPQESLPKNVKDRINEAMIDAKTYLDTLAQNAQSLSLSEVDISQEAQKAFRETGKEELERKKGRDLLELKQQRLLNHIRDNILHYCRAIWLEEDPEQRYLRYQKLNIRIPTIWKFTMDSNEYTNFENKKIFTDEGLLVKGNFYPDLSDKDTLKPVVDLIKSTKPIGFVGNYAVFQIKNDLQIDASHKNDLFDLLHLARSDYLDPELDDKVIDPVLLDIIQNVRIPQPSIPKEEKKEMVDLVPDLRAEYLTMDEQKRDQIFDDEARFKKYYHEYLFRKENTRRFLVDANNLIVDIEVGSGTSLENFKKLHRYIDVLKAYTEKEKAELENIRRQKLIDAKRLGDPEIDKATVVAGIKNLSDGVNIDLLNSNNDYDDNLDDDGNTSNDTDQ